MDTRFNRCLQTPSSNFNSLPSPQTLGTDFPNRTLISADFDITSPSSTETTPDSSPDPVFTSEDDPKSDENDALSSASDRERFEPYSIYRWSEPWVKIAEVKPLQESNWGNVEPETVSSNLSDWRDWPKPATGDMDDNKTPISDWLNSPKAPAEMETRPSVSDFFHSENKPALVGAGLANLGNTCFLNSILQCFMHTVPLLQGLLAYDHKVPCEYSSRSFCVICSLCELTELTIISTERIVSPWKFVDNLNYFSSSFQRFQQEDAHEFLQCFLDRLERRCDGLKLINSVLSKSDNLVKQVFGGRLVSKLKCCNCGHCSDTYEPSIDLSLEIEDADTLLVALQSFTKVEKIEDPETQFTCEECKMKVSIEKQLLLDQAPSVAAFHLKRFKTDGSYVEKIDKHVQFPLQLDLLPYTGYSESNYEELKYDLYAVVVHIGFTSTSGHYYCFIRSSPDSWYKFDDSKVVRVQEDYVLSQEAYVLFYAKQGTPLFLDFIESQKQIFEATVLNTSPKSVLDSMDVYSSCSTAVNNHGRDVNETTDSENALMENYTGPQEIKVGDGQAKYDSRTNTPPASANNSSDSFPIHVVSPSVLSRQSDCVVSPPVLACQPEYKISPSVLKEHNCNQESGAVRIMTPRTPPRSPSPEIYREDPPDNVYSIPREHLKLAEQVSCKRQLNKDLEDMERKQACKLIKKNMPGSRGQQLLAAMEGSRSEGSINKKRSRMETYSRSDNSNSTARRRSSIGPGVNTLAPRSIR